jgi:hypothetical protein
MLMSLLGFLDMHQIKHNKKARRKKKQLFFSLFKEEENFKQIKLNSEL